MIKLKKSLDFTHPEFHSRSRSLHAVHKILILKYTYTNNLFKLLCILIPVVAAGFFCRELHSEIYKLKIVPEYSSFFSDLTVSLETNKHQNPIYLTPVHYFSFFFYFRVQQKRSVSLSKFTIDFPLYFPSHQNY